MCGSTRSGLPVVVVVCAFCAAACSGPSDDRAREVPSVDSGEAGSDTAPDPDAGETGDTSEDADGPCVPSRSAWEENVSGMVDEWCGQCHGETPKYGAPYPLTNYDDLVEGEPDERKVDRMAEQLLKDAMPPPTADQPEHVAEDTLVEWSTCGEKHPDHSKDVHASAPPMDAPEDPPPDAETLDVVANDFELGKNELNRYQCFVVDVPFESTRYVRRFEPIVDDDRVLHHALVAIDSEGSQDQQSFRCSGFPPGDGLMYGWAPGQNPIQFDKGGIEVEPGSQVVLQIHYNNGAGAPNVSDSSGVRLFHTGSAERAITMSALGPWQFQIPAESRASASSTCTVEEETELIASFPHMHEIGSEFHSDIQRQDGSTETLIDLTGWSFEAQLAYETPKTLQPGDRVTTECVWDNPEDESVRFGERTEDEMCFNFAYVSPPNPRFCR